MIEDKLSQSSVFEDGKLALKGGEAKGRMPVAMAANLSYPKDVSLFDALDEKDRGDYVIKTESKLIRGNGKPIYLSNSEHKVLNALTFFITQYLDDEDIKTYMYTLDEKGKIPKQKYINRYISITWLSQFINGGSSRERERKAAFRHLKNIASTYQVQQLNLKNAVYINSEPLIILGGKAAKFEETGKNSFEDMVEVLFGPLFFVEVSKKYSIITQKLFEVWGKEKGTTLDIFPIILSDLNAKYRQYYIRAQKVKAEIEKEIESDENLRSKSSEYLDKLMESRLKGALTYESKAETLKEKVTTDYESTRQYKSKFWKDLQSCIDALKTYGIISDAVIDKKTDKIKFVFNLKFGNEQTRLKGKSRRK